MTTKKLAEQREACLAELRYLEGVLEASREKTSPNPISILRVEKKIHEQRKRLAEIVIREAALRKT
jgi:hypothetical protein